MFSKIIQQFNEWSKLKIALHLNSNDRSIYFKERQIWWASIGQNVGVEANGKNKKFERPVIILKKFNPTACLVVTLSTKEKTGFYYFELSQGTSQRSFVNLSQIKLMSSKRLIRKIGEVSQKDMVKIKYKIKAYI